MTDLYDLLCADVRRILYAARDPELFCQPEDIVILPGRRTGMLSTPSAIAMVPSRRTDPGRYATKWAERARNADADYGFSATAAGYMDIAVPHRKVLGLLNDAVWPSLPPGKEMAEPDDPLFFVYFLRRRLASLADGDMTHEAVPSPDAWEMDWHLLRGTHLVSRGKPGLVQVWAVRARELFEELFARSPQMGRMRLAAMDALLAEAERKCHQNR